MSNENSKTTQPTEIELLRERAKIMGITFHSATGLKKLKDLVEAKLNPPSETSTKTDTKSVPEKTVTSKPVLTDAQKEGRRRMGIRQKATALIRCTIMNMNPNKKDFPGEIFTVSNRIIGTVKKFVPYNSEAPYHVPAIILNQLRQKKCQVFISKRDPVTGAKSTVSKMIKEFVIDILPQLSQKELEDLAKRQTITGSIDE